MKVEIGQERGVVGRTLALSPSSFPGHHCRLGRLTILLGASLLSSGKSHCPSVIKNALKISEELFMLLALRRDSGLESSRTYTPCKLGSGVIMLFTSQVS